ncbi:MAG: TrkH family potassium uptake protein [Dehalogenimonas sp.]|uniref:TrkH family potassium uptake protein n=1 Tax=Candidatus Dehalogenimonas loeffleri TaxID=3127115 RepID=A0ABZ2J134_9CHLR|nr:TrkH family potassium uptake protein [Dehalogenimonas sp.]
MNLITIVHFLSLLVTLLGGVMAVPTALSLVQGEPSAGAMSAATIITTFGGGLVFLLTRSRRQKLAQRDVFVLVVAAWVAACIFGALPYYFSGALPTFLDAFFEAMSGFTTTGATVMTHISDQSQGILLWRSLTQWLGGMGIITLFVALFPLLGIGAAQMADAEMPGEAGERMTSRIRETAKVLWLIYISFTVLCFGSLMVAGLPLFDSVNISLTTLPTGGFAPVNLSIEEYGNTAVQLIVNFFMLLAGINFALFYYLFMKRKPGKLFKNPEFQLYIGLMAAAILFITFNLVVNDVMPFADALRQGSFQATSIMTTTGYTSANYDTWPVFSRAIILMLMVVGGSAGATAGGIKVIRLLVLIKYSYRRVVLAFNPNAVIPLKVGDTVMPEKTVSRIMSLTVLYLAILWGGFLVMSALGLDIETALSAVVSAISNVGPGLGGVGPYENFAWIPDAGKGVLIVLMLAGRLELFTLLVLFVPSFWRRY